MRFLRARAHLHVLMTQKSCAVGMRNAKLENHLNCLLCFSYVIPTDNKQLLDEVEHDIVNYQNRGLCYLPKSKAEADDTDMISCENRIE